eukprot:6419428-Pyramimonas_sp.AAC.1
MRWRRRRGRRASPSRGGWTAMRTTPRGSARPWRSAAGRLSRRCTPMGGHGERYGHLRGWLSEEGEAAGCAKPLHGCWLGVRAQPRRGARRQGRADAGGPWPGGDDAE